MTCTHVYEDGSTCKRNVKVERCWQHKKHETTDVLLAKMADTAQATDSFMRQFKAAGVTE